MEKHTSQASPEALQRIEALEQRLRDLEAANRQLRSASWWSMAGAPGSSRKAWGMAARFILPYLPIAPLRKKNTLISTLNEGNVMNGTRNGPGLTY